MFIIILTLVMTFKPVLPLVDYAINYDYISEVLCINKDKPELQCNGKCHLKSELAKAKDDTSNQDNDNNQPSKRVLQVEFLHNHPLQIVLKSFHLNESHSKFRLNQNYDYLYSKSIFHPPLV